MDSIRKPGYKVEPKPVAERKRRRSDLVVMWLSIWNVSTSILFECWLMIEGIWEELRFYFNLDDRLEVRKWLKNYLPRVPEDFAESWRDGLLLSTLLNKLQPGCFPDADRLDPSYGLRNMYHVFQVLEYHFNITPKFTVEEVITCGSGSDSKLLDLLLQLKKETDALTNEVEPAAHTEESKDKSCESSSSTNCVARGTGLMVGFVGRAANFIVFFESLSDLDLVVEIKGPCDTICTERVTKRSPKKKQVLQPWKPTSVYQIARSSSNEDKRIYVTKKDIPTSKKEKETRYMPLEYEVHSNRIYFAYMPLVKGQHQIKILSQGMHVSDSPYTVPVGPVVGAHKKAYPVCLKSSLEFGTDDAELRKTSVRFQESKGKRERLGKVIKRRVLRYIVKIDNKDVVVDTDNINNLATSLLKMDYEFQKPPLNRRNSWGFVGDAERKVSVIRQFCVNLDDLEAQSARLHRSHSFSSNSKKVLNKRTSYECEDIIEQKKLETVAEGTVSNFEASSFRNSEEFACLNEDFENEREIFKNNNESCPVDDKYTSDDDKYTTETDDTRAYTEKFIEGTPYKNDVVDDESLSSHRKIKATLNFSEAMTGYFNRRQGIEELPVHLTSASEISGRVSDQTNDDGEISKIQSTTKKDVKSETLPVKKKLRDEIKDFESYNEEESISLTQSTVLAENVESNKDIYYNTKTVQKQNDIYIPEELDIKKETIIEEEPFTKTDISTVKNIMFNEKSETSTFFSRGDFKVCKTEVSQNNYPQLYIPEELVNQIETVIEEKPSTKTDVNTEKNKMYRKQNDVSVHFSRGIHNACSTEAKKNHLESNSIDISNNNDPKYPSVQSQQEHLWRKKIIANKNPCLKLQNKRTIFPNTKVLRNRQKHFYKHPKTKINLMSSFEQSSCGNALNIKTKYNNKFIKSKRAIPSPKIENITPSFDPNNIRTKSPERNSYFHDLKDFNFRNGEKNSQENQQTFHLNNLKNHNMPYHSRSGTNDDREKKLTTKFKARTNPKYREYFSNNEQYPRKINLNKNNCLLPNSFSDESGIQITSPTQTHGPISDTSFDNSRPLTNYTLVGLGQLNFKHFNPTFPNARASLVKNRIQQWEKTVERQDIEPRSKSKHTTQSQKGDITSKLKFWETAVKKEKVNKEVNNGMRRITDICNEMEDGITDTAQFSVTGRKMENNVCNKFKTDVVTINSRADIKPVLNKTLIVSRKKLVDDHHSGTHIFSKTRRSASDPGVLEQTTHEANCHDPKAPKYDSHESSTTDEQASSQESLVHEISKTSSVEYPSSSSFLDNSIDDEEDSSIDLMDSSEDEYIDDEISESASTYWGDLSVMERLKLANTNEYRDLGRIMDADLGSIGKDIIPVRPIECQVFGIATYFGYVAIKNRFQVLTKGAGSGNLSATLQGFGRHDVSYVSVRYTQKDVYEVTYQVMSPGLYLISVRWMENPIVGSPFLCKVTF